MRPWNEAIPALRETIVRHFPEASPERIDHFTDEIYNGADAAASLQWIERHDRRPEQEVEDLEMAASYLESAAKRIQALGIHGGFTVKELARKVHQMRFRHDAFAALGAEGSIETIAQFFEGFAEEIRCCANAIDPHAPTALSELGDDRPAGNPRGRPKATSADFIARECHTAFSELSGDKPSVTTDAHAEGHPARGPFMDFLRDVFKVLGVRESVEASARKVCKEKNPIS